MRGSLPRLVPLGDDGLLVRFGDGLSDAANEAAIRLARRLAGGTPEGVREIEPTLVSVLLKYDPAATDFWRLAGEVRLLLAAGNEAGPVARASWRIAVRFGGEAGPDLDAVAAGLQLSPAEFIAAHNASNLRVLTTGFAPGFAYCGFHPEGLRLPRRPTTRPPVPPGSVLFAAGQTAITSTAVPTGWHVIGRTAFRNFDPGADPPTQMREGDRISFEAAP